MNGSKDFIYDAYKFIDYCSLTDMKCYRLRLVFLGATHFGDRNQGVGLESAMEYIHSDTLFSALCHAWAALFDAGDLETCLGDFPRLDDEGNLQIPETCDGTLASLPFCLSSAFVYYGKHNFFPRPRSLPPGFGHADPAVRASLRERFGKKIKRVRFLQEHLVTEWLQDRHEKSRDDYHLFYDQVKSSQELYDRATQTFLNPRNALDRQSGMSSIFQVGYTSYAQGAGLSFYVTVQEKYRNKLAAALSLLGEMGLGGERTYGCGLFAVEGQDEGHPHGWWQEYSLPLLSPADYCYSLSLFYPTKLNFVLSDDRLGYDLIDRRGWFHSPYSGDQLKRKSVRMFQEGSILPFDGDPGALVEVSPPVWRQQPHWHPIYRCGLRFPWVAGGSSS